MRRFRPVVQRRSVRRISATRTSAVAEQRDAAGRRAQRDPVDPDPATAPDSDARPGAITLQDGLPYAATASARRAVPPATVYSPACWRPARRGCASSPAASSASPEGRRRDAAPRLRGRVPAASAGPLRRWRRSPSWTMRPQRTRPSSTPSRRPRACRRGRRRRGCTPRRRRRARLRRRCRSAAIGRRSWALFRSSRRRTRSRPVRAELSRRSPERSCSQARPRCR